VVWNIQTNFTSGVLDPKLNGRIDLGIYYNGVQSGDNVIILPQVGMTRRPSFEYLNTLAARSRLFAFEFNTSTLYIIAMDENNWYSYQPDGTLADSGAHTFGADIFEADYVQSRDTLILVHPDQPPARLNRLNATTFSFVNINLLNIPQFNFNDINSPIATSNAQEITFTNFNTSDRYRLVLEGFLTEELSFAADAATNAQRIQEALLDLPITDSNPITVVVGVPGSVAGPYLVSLGFGSAGNYEEYNGVIVSAQSVNAEISATVIQPGSSQKEDVWSATRGYPRTVIFHENRLVFGGSKSKPNTLWLSFANDFFNFKEGTGRADEAIIANLDTDQLNEIVGLSTNRNLQVFTTGQEFFVPTSPTTPITPENFVIKPQSRYGAKEVKPQVIDGFTNYIQRTGASVRRFQLSEFESSYDSISVSLLAPDLIRNPTDMTVQKGVFNIDASYLYIINDDGTLGVYLSKKEEGLNGWALWTTDGDFQHVVAVGDDLYVSTEREINGSTVHFLEKLYSNPTAEMWCDAGVRYDQTPSNTVTGLDHLNGQSIRVVADVAVQADNTPVAGSITLAKNSAFGWVGLDYNPFIRTMPAAAQAANGQIFPLRKRWVRVRPLVLNSLGVYLSDGDTEIFVPDRQFDITPLDQPPVPRSGIDQGVKFLGWTYEAQIDIYQKDPLPFTITSLSTELR